MRWIETILTSLMVFILAVPTLGLVLFFLPVGLWLSALAAGVPMSLSTLMGMRMRKVSPHAIVPPLISATKAGLDLNINEMEAHHLSGGSVARVVTAMISAEKANIDLLWRRATAIDLAGRDVLEAVQTSVNPKVINTPNVSAVAKDGIQLIAIARVTVRANLDRLVGGAGEGTVSAIGSANSHKEVLENPDQISKRVLAGGLDQGTAFEILSIDIADVDVGKNIGAQLQIDQAEADKQIAHAHAEQRRAAAVAVEKEMVARTEEMRALVVEAEAEVPKAMAESFRAGNLGIMDYYRMRNIQTDTQMHESMGQVRE